MEKNNIVQAHSRRNILRSFPAAGATLAFGHLATDGTVSAEDGDTVQLGEFSDGLDGWTTTGSNELTRVAEDELPTAVQVGTHALGVEIDGDLRPLIENRKRVKGADFAGHPYLLAHVLGYAEETNSDVVFRFRLHHTDAPPDEKGQKGGDGGKDALVVESDEQAVAQLEPQHLRWDLRDLDDDALETAKRLELVWYLADHEPEEGKRGRARGDFRYRGMVAVDDVRLTDDVAGAEARASQEKRMALHRAHGMVVERSFEERTVDLERGSLVFADGAEVAYELEVLDDGQFRYTIDGETFLLGGALA